MLQSRIKKKSQKVLEILDTKSKLLTKTKIKNIDKKSKNEVNEKFVQIRVQEKHKIIKVILKARCRIQYFRIH